MSHFIKLKLNRI